MPVERLGDDPLAAVVTRGTPAVPAATPCPAEGPVRCEPCPAVFDRVHVSYLIRGGTRVLWDLLPSFTDPGPLTFRLQVGQTANPDADDWRDVGIPVVDAYFAVDPHQRTWGKLNRAHYRVVLETGRGVYASEPVGDAGVLSPRDWRTAREIVRVKRQAFRYGPSGQRGYLLKRRWTGTRCPRCLDFQTEEVRDPNCPVCYGTGFQCGYYYPMSCVWAALDPQSHRTHIDGNLRGTVAESVTRAEMLQTELMGENDVWVAAGSDDRYYVHQVQNTAEIRGVPLVASVELRAIPYTSAVYDIAIPQELAALEGP